MIRTIFSEMFFRRHVSAVVFRPVSINAHRDANQGRMRVDRNKYVEFDKAVKTPRPLIDIAPEEAKPPACTSTETTSVMVGVVFESFAAHVGGELSLGAEAM